jgi:hypothetical protein
MFPCDSEKYHIDNKLTLILFMSSVFAILVGQ